MFEFCITRPMGWIIEQIYSLVANYGLSIIIFTILFKLVLLPLNIKSQKAMKKTQKIQPLLAELQKKYANDQEKLQMETMKLYKENNVSMTGGCLPMLIQLPILFGLYRVIYAPIKYLLGVSDVDGIARVGELKDAIVAAGENIGNLASMGNDAIWKNSQIQVSQWAQKLSQGDPWTINFNFLGLDLSNVPSKAFGYLTSGNLDWSMILLLLIPILAVAAAVVSNKITMAQSGQNNSGNETAAQMSKSMNIMMPLMTGFFTLTLPAGLGIYWIISSIMQIIQQLVLNYYLDKKGDDFVVKVPERKQIHGKNSKKRR